jgi:hypothetical protein
VWLCLGLILIVILVSEGNENLWPAIIIFGFPGGLLLYFGQRYLMRRKAIINTALFMLREPRSIDVVELAHRVGLSEDFVAQILAEVRRKGIIPESDHGRSRD